MKKIVMASLLSLSGVAMAAGAYDGIYAESTSSGSYIAVNTNGTQVVATAYNIDSISGITFPTQLGSLRPSQINTWNLLLGTISGSTATLAGQFKYNACNVTALAVFDGSGATVTLTSSSNTASATASGFNCGGLMVNTPVRFNKIF